MEKIRKQFEAKKFEPVPKEIYDQIFDEIEIESHDDLGFKLIEILTYVLSFRIFKMYDFQDQSAANFRPHIQFKYYTFATRANGPDLIHADIYLKDRKKKRFAIMEVKTDKTCPNLGNDDFFKLYLI